MRVAAIAPRRRALGFSLLEVLVALMLLAGAALGGARLAARTYQQLQATQQRAAALLLAQDHAERARMNPRGLQEGRYALGLDQPPPAAAAPAADLADAAEAARRVAALDQRNLLTTAAAQLPQARAQVKTTQDNGAQVLQVWLVWWTAGAAAEDGLGAANQADCPAELGKPAPEQACLFQRFAL
ncbi:type IV pilus assembly protein PilV [Pseudacidovorax sp. 1753]